MTAVTTAGLLAGLFGSAFVPAVRAANVPTVAANTAVIVIDDTSTGYEGTATVGGTAQFYAVVGKALTVSYSAHAGAATTLIPDANTAQTVTVSVTGATITALAGFGTATLMSPVLALDAKSLTFALDDTATPAELAAGKITIKPTTAGTDVTVAYSFKGDNAAVGLGAASTVPTRTIKVIAASRLKVSLPVQTGGSTATATNITVDATTTNWSDTHDTSGTVVVVPKNDYTSNIAGEVIEVVSGNVNLVTVAATNVAGAPSCDDSAVTATASSDADGVDVIVCPVQDEAGTTTLTFKSDGVVILTKTYTVLGPVATLTPTQTMSYLATGASMTESDTLNIASIVAKDKAGNVLTTPTLTYYVDSYESNTVNQTVTAGTGYVGFEAGLCATAGTTKSIQAKATYTSVDLATVTVSSAAWTVTCTGTAGKITKLEFDKAAYLPSSAIKINATAVDSAGRPLGYGGGSIDTTGELTFVKQGTIVLPGAGANEITFVGWDDGVAQSSATSHSATGDFGIVITIADNDLGTAVVPESISIVSTVSNILASAVDGSLAVGPKKLKATATFGLAAAGKKIAFTLENASTGAVKTYYRKANASGVATFTLSFRGTFEVTAAWGDYMTDSLTLKK